jgi:hypothetical protein
VRPMSDCKAASSPGRWDVAQRSKIDEPTIDLAAARTTPVGLASGAASVRSEVGKHYVERLGSINQNIWLQYRDTASRRWPLTLSLLRICIAAVEDEL